MATLTISTLPERIKRWVRPRERPAPRPPQAALADSHRFFADLTRQDGVAAVRFERGEAVVELADGRRFLLDPAIKAARMYSVPFTGTFEPRETAFIRALVRPGDVCVDVGANFGWFTLLMGRRAGPAGAVHAFEPVPQTAALLRRNVALNGCGSVRVCEAALDSAAGERPLFVPDIGVSGSFAVHAHEAAFDTFAVPTTRLDDYAAAQRLERLDVLKADIEGAELAMLRGGAETLRRFRPALLLEVQASSTRLFGHEPAAVFDFLATLGYEAHRLGPQGDPIHVEPHGDELPDYNFAFLPRGGR